MSKESKEKDKPFMFTDYIPDYLRGLEIKLGGITIKIDDFFEETEEEEEEDEDGKIEGRRDQESCK